jgi:hypothetical protein
MTKATLIKESFYLGLAWSFGGLSVRDHHVGKYSITQGSETVTDLIS